jgi:hypothetical protein
LSYILICTLNYKGIFSLVFFPHMFMYMCTCVNKWTCLRRARYYVRIVCSLFFLLCSSVKINQMMESIAHQLSWIYMRTYIYMVRIIT